MPVVDVREVRVRVRECLVDVCVGMRITRRIFRRMGMLVMDIVAVRVYVGQTIVRMSMTVPLCEVKPDAERHEPTCRDQHDGDGLMPEEDRQDGADEWRSGKIGARPRRAETPERKDEQHEAQPVTKESEHESRPDP